MAFYSLFMMTDILDLHEFSTGLVSSWSQGPLRHLTQAYVELLTRLCPMVTTQLL